MPYHKREKPKRNEKTVAANSQLKATENDEAVAISAPDSEHQGSDQQADKKIYQWRECVICLLKCSPTSTVWSCQSCRITCHLKCLKDWVCKQNNIENYNPKTSDRSILYTWTCPHCVISIKETMPNYMCFCLKQKNPKADPFIEPHSCGQRCGRSRGPQCSHPCGELCHSGPCPPCKIIIPSVSCYCGNEVIDRECGEFKERSCGIPCEKTLNCNLHKCERACHDGECPPCSVPAPQTKCYCEKVAEDKKCGESHSCGGTCDKTLHCGIHKCKKKCHSGYTCKLTSESVETVNSPPTLTSLVTAARRVKWSC